MPSIRLSSADRERLDCPELLPVDLGSITNREAIALRSLGFPTPMMFRRALTAREDKDDQGQPYVAVDYEAWTGLVWIALRRAGVEAELATLEFDTEGLSVVPDPEPAPVKSQGKASAPDPSTK